MAEVYCYGHVSTGRVLRLRDLYPEADGYAEVVCTRAPSCVHPPALDEVRELLSVKR